MDHSRFKNHEEAWVEWLKEPATPVQHTAPIVPDLSYAAPEPVGLGAPALPVAPVAKKTVQIDIKLPKIKAIPGKQTVAQLRSTLLPKVATKKVAGALAVSMLTVAIGLNAHNLPGIKASDKSQSASADTTQATDIKPAPPVAKKPSFTVLAPKGKAQLGQVGTPKTAYDGGRNTFSFMDTYLGTELTVSEQPIPPKFSSPQDAASKIAQSLHAKEVIGVANGAAFMVSDAKSNSQTIVYSVHDVIVFIQSPFKKDSLNWKYYLDGLQ